MATLRRLRSIAPTGRGWTASVMCSGRGGSPEPPSCLGSWTRPACAGTTAWQGELASPDRQAPALTLNVAVWDDDGLAHVLNGDVLTVVANDRELGTARDDCFALGRGNFQRDLDGNHLGGRRRRRGDYRRSGRRCWRGVGRKQRWSGRSLRRIGAGFRCWSRCLRMGCSPADPSSRSIL